MTTDTPSASPVRASGNNVDAPTSVAAPREHFASRLGFILISAGCAIGLGNVWRFPYIAGEYGGAAFILMYLIFLVILGLPVMVMEFAVGRASQRSAAQAFDMLAALAALALVLLVGLHRLHAAHDVLHHGLRLDARLHGENGHGHLRRP